MSGLLMRGNYHRTLRYKSLNQGMLHEGHHRMSPIDYNHILLYAIFGQQNHRNKC